MRLFNCTSCGNLIFFENVSCVQCQARLGFIPDHLRLVALETAGENFWRICGTEEEKGLYRKCHNYSNHAVCNWMLDANQEGDFCKACSLNRTIPDISDQKNKFLWYKLEIEKRRLIYSLLRLGLPVVSRHSDPAGLTFDFLANTPSNFTDSGQVFTGHSNGVITINIAEADPVVRVQMRSKMSEKYRTILGHFRHESGHYYWDKLISGEGRQDEFRKLFGNETEDYSQSLARHYEFGPPADWHHYFVSAYASCHPWEDWAETWAHYLHIVDTLETAHHFGLKIDARWGEYDGFKVAHDFDAYNQNDFKLLVRHWIPLTIALNSINRSIGHAHVYPFVLTPSVIEKLEFVHHVIRSPRCI